MHNLFMLDKHNLFMLIIRFRTNLNYSLKNFKRRNQVGFQNIQLEGKLNFDGMSLVLETSTYLKTF